MKNLEREYKWEAFSSSDFKKFTAALRKFSSPSGPLALPITDYYLDDKKGLLDKNQIAMRIRQTGKNFEVTLKTKTEIIAGKAQRKEVTRTLPGIHCVGVALAALNAKPLFPELGLEELEIRFSIRNKRTVYVVRPDARTEYEAALDDFAIDIKGRKVLMKEIELELKKGKTADFEKFAHLVGRESGLSAAKISKVKTAALISRIWS